MKFKMVHGKIGVADIEKSVEFYSKALGLKIVREMDRGDTKLIFMANDDNNWEIELGWKKDKDAYDLGDNDTHLGVRVDDLEAALSLHESMGCVTMKSPRGMYFIADPDGYQIEILPMQ